MIVSCSTLRESEIATGIQWRAAYNVLGERMSEGSTKLRRKSNGSGVVKRRYWSTHGSGIMATRCWPAARKGGDSVCSGCANLWVITLMWVGRARKARCSGTLRAFPVSCYFLLRFLTQETQLPRRSILAPEQNYLCPNSGDPVN